jgi:EmrB/QacA subfamily drug resistance transporter
MISPIRAKFCLIIVAIAMFMDSMDTTILNTAIPEISKDLHVHPIELKIALISYLMSLAIFIPISGWICDKYGIKKTFLSAIGIFTIASLGCGFAHHIHQLIILRFIQGIGGALNVPVARLIILKSFPKKEFLPKMNLVIMIASIASMVGPMVGGFIVVYLNWSWIFWVNVPIGILNFFIIKKYLHDFPSKKIHPLDKLGFVLFGLALSLMMLSLSMLSNIEIKLHIAFEILLMSLIFFLSYFIHSRKQKNPIILLSLFKQKTFTISILGGFISRICFGGLPFLIPLFFQISLGKTPVTSGFLIFFLPLGAFFSRPISIDILEKFGFKKSLIYNTIIMALIIFNFSNMNAQSPLWQFFTSLTLLGICLTIQYAALSTLCFENISDDNMGASSSIFSTMQQFGISVGVATSALFLRFYSINEVLTAHTFMYSFLSLSVLPILLIVLFYQLENNAGNSMIGRENDA